MHNHKTDWLKYILVFGITVALFATATYLSNYFNNKKIQELKSIQDNVAIDLLSSETQFSLLEESSCSDFSKENVLSQELATLSDKIAYSEKNIGAQSEDVLKLKRYYSLLEIKDYLLMKRLSERCNHPSVFILHFYKNENCEDCVKEWYVLGELRAKYPDLRVYSFDTSLDLSTIKTMVNIYKIKDEMPTLVLDDKVFPGYQDMEAIERAMPELAKSLEADKAGTATTTSTKKSITNTSTAKKQ